MSTVIGLQELISHINDVYPKRAAKAPDGRENTMTTVSTNKVVPLDLADIRKEQRRLAALLDIKSRDPQFSVPKPRPRPSHKHRCIICNLPSADRKGFNRGGWVGQQSIVIPRVPNPSFYDDFQDSNSGSDAELCVHHHKEHYSDADDLFGDSLHNFGQGTFKLPTLEAEIILDETTCRLRKDRFKLPPVFASDDSSSSSDPGRVMALASDKTFLITSIGRRNYDGFHPTYSDNPRSPFLRQIKESESPLASPNMSGTRRRDQRRNTISDTELPSRSEINQHKRRKEKLRRRVSIHADTVHHLDNLPESTTLRYHHRQPSDILPVPLNTPEIQYLDRESQDYFRRNSNSDNLDRESQDYFWINSTSDRMGRRNSREISFEFVRDDGSSVYSRDTSFEETPTGFVARVKSGSWCECSGVDVSRLRCSECLKIGGHQRWCVSKIGICPECGKAVGKSMQILGERRLSRSPTFTLRKHSLGAVSSGVPRELQKLKPHSSDLKVRFSGTDDVRSISPTEPLTVRDKDHSDTKVNSVTKNDVVESKEHKPKVKRSSSLKHKISVSSKPAFDADIHKAAYELALADSRAQKQKKDKSSDKSLSKSLTGTLFSYFPKLRRSPSKSVSPNSIGLRDPDDKEKVKVKKGMKHIFGKVKVEDYYPDGKKGRKTEEKTIIRIENKKQ